MEERLDYISFAPMFGMWAEMFKPFIESKEMYDIYQKIKNDAQKETIVPNSENVFRVFANTSPNNIKTIWYLMDPYPRRYKDRSLQATGVAMDCSNSPDGKIQPSLEKFYDAIHKDTKKKPRYDPNLQYLLDQGVMLVNTDFTCKLNKTGSHEGLWTPFQKFFLQELMGSRIDITYVLAGKASEKMEQYINPFAPIIKLEHPAFAERMHRDWDHKNVFTNINKRLKDQGKKPIMWNSADWDAESLKDLPF